MGTINIITDPNREPHPWILRRAAEEAAKARPGITINGPSADINYFVNYALYQPMGGVHIGHFTHLEETGSYRAAFLRLIPQFRYYTVTCNITRNILIHEMVPDDKIWQIRYGCDERLRRRELVFGVCGSVKPTGRKGEHLVRKMVNAGFTVQGWGEGWPCQTVRAWDKLPSFYSVIDYLVVTSTIEGGPVPVIDAIAAGVPVIAPDVGWCWEFPVIRYEKGSWNSLYRVLQNLCLPPTWHEWTSQHRCMFRDIEDRECL